MKFRCHGKDNKGKDCPASIGILEYMFGSAMCIDCQIEMLKLRMEELKAKKKVQDFKTFRR